jgi:hypothetical protein
VTGVVHLVKTAMVIIFQNVVRFAILFTLFIKQM